MSARHTLVAQLEGAPSHPADDPKVFTRVALAAAGPVQELHHPEAARKAFATLQARAALAGWVLERTTEDDGTEAFVVSRWSRTRTFTALAEVEVLLGIVAPQIGGLT